MNASTGDNRVGSSTDSRTVLKPASAKAQAHHTGTLEESNVTKLVVIPSDVKKKFRDAADYGLSPALINHNGKPIDKEWFFDDWCNVYRQLVETGDEDIAQEFADTIMEDARAMSQSLKRKRESIV